MRIRMCCVAIVAAVLSIWPVLAASGAPTAPAAATPADDVLDGDVLVLDFTGLFDSKVKEHASQFTSALLPSAKTSAFGFHGIVPDAWRGSAGYSRILRADNPATRAREAREIVEAFTKTSKNVLAFDINESVVPNQLGNLLPFIQDRKVRNPGLLAAQVAMNWQQKHPQGKIVLVGHSDGTEVNRVALDELIRQGVAPHAVINQSPRSNYDAWASRASKLPQTLFVSIHADADFPRASPVDKGFLRPGPANMVAYNIKGHVNPFKAHGAVTELSKPVTLQRSHGSGPISAHTSTSIASLLREDFKQVAAAPKSGSAVALRPGSVPNPAAQPQAGTPPHRFHQGAFNSLPLSAAQLAAYGRDLSQFQRQMQAQTAMWTMSLQDTLTAVKTLRDHLLQSPALPKDSRDALRAAAIAADLQEEVLRATQEADGKGFAALSPQALQRMSDLTVRAVQLLADTAPESKLTDAFRPFLQHAGNVRDLGQALGDLAGGKRDPDTVQKALQNTVELVRAKLTDDHRQAERRRLSIDKLEADLDRRKSFATRLEQRLETAQRDVHRDALRTQIKSVRADIGRLEGRLVRQTAALETSLQGFGSKLLLLDFFPLYGAAVAEHVAAQGRITVKVADRYSDAVIVWAATALVIPLMATPMAEVVPAVRDGIIDAARYTREQTAEFTIEKFGRHFGNRFALLDAYTQYQALQVKRGARSLDFDDYFGTDELRRAGFSRHEVYKINEQNWLLNDHQHAQARAQKGTAGVAPQVTFDDKKPKPEALDRDPKKPLPNQTVAIDPRDRPPPGGQSVSGAPGKTSPTPATQTAAPRLPSSGSSGSDGQRLGGVKPGTDNVVTSRGMPAIDAVVVDPATGRLVLLSRGRATAEALDPTYLALALYFTFTKQEIAFSLDPADGDPNGEWLTSVHYPSALAGLANFLYEADFHLKLASFCLKVDGDRYVPHEAGGPLPCLPDMLRAEQSTASGQWTRNWIEPEFVELVAAEGAVRVEAIRMAVHAKRQVLDQSSPTGLRDAPTDPRSVESRWAAKATESFDAVAKTAEGSSWARVRELSKALAIARWLRDQGAHVDVNSLVPIIEASRLPYVQRVKAIRVSYAHDERVPEQRGDGQVIKTTRHELHLFGGVKPAGRIKTTESVAAIRLQRAVAAAMSSKGGSQTQFEVRDASHLYTARVTDLQIRLSGTNTALRGDSTGPTRAKP